MENLRIVFLDEYTVHDSDLSEIRSLGKYTGYESTEPEDIVARCQGMQVVITNKSRLTAEVINELPDLKLICIAATGMNNVDLDAAAKAGVIVKNARDYSTHAVAESTVAGALSLMKQLAYYDNYVKSGAYSASSRLFDFGRPTYELYGKKWGVIGLGNIGRRVAQLAQAFGCAVSYYSTSGKNTTTDFIQTSLDGLLASSDIVSVHAPLSRSTYHLLGREQFAVMKPTAIVINVARGSIVDEQAFADAINNGMIAGAALDVYSTEPMKADNPIITVMDKYRLVLTPHSSWATKESLQLLVHKVAENIREFGSQYA